MLKKILSVAVVLQLMSCQKNDVEKLESDLTVKNGLVITSFIEDGENELEDVKDYVFTFTDNGTVSALKNNVTSTGTYRVFKDDGKVELTMNFNNNSNLSELSDDWYFVSSKDGIITFEEENDLLVFKSK
jgi:hypothetical protein